MTKGENTLEVETCSSSKCCFNSELFTVTATCLRNYSAPTSKHLPLQRSSLSGILDSERYQNPDKIEHVPFD